MTGPESRRLVRPLWLAGCGALMLLILLVLAADLRLVTHLDRVPGAFDGLVDRPADAAGTTILLVGTVTADKASGPRVGWLPDEPVLESLMLVEIPLGTARHAYVVSLSVSGDLARSVATGRASATVGAVEAATGRRVEHLAALDWSALQQLAADNVGGLAYEPGSGITAQQKFLRRVLAGTLHTEMRREPWNLYAALETVSRELAVDDQWSMLEMDLLVLSLRDLRSDEIGFRVAQP